MNCSIEFQRRNYSIDELTQAFDDDSGSWWWWINISGSLSIGLIGLIGNLICFFVLRRFSLRHHHSFVEYLRALAIFDLIALLFEFVQSLNDLIFYLFSFQILNFRSSILCKCWECFHHTMILLSCWTIVGLSIDRLILVCDPLINRWTNLSRRFCQCQTARRILLSLILISFGINLPHSIFHQWICRYSGHENSAAFYLKSFDQRYLNPTNQSRILICKCRLSKQIRSETLFWIVKWKIYVFHLFCYTLLPAILLIASNTAILKRLHQRRQIVGQQNEHLKSKLTRTLTIISLMFLILYFPHALAETFSIVIIPYYQSECDVQSLIYLRILKRLCELLNFVALAMNFFIYILGVNHYRSATIQMLHLHHFQCFIPYLTVEHRNSLASFPFHSQQQQQQRRNTSNDPTTIKLFKFHSDQHENNRISKTSIDQQRLSNNK